MKPVSIPEMKKILRHGTVYVHTDRGTFAFSGKSDETVLNFENEYMEGTIRIYDKGGDTVYRETELWCKTDITLYEIELRFPTPKDKTDFIFYRTFIDAPAAAFIRCGDIGFYTGVENPFFTAAEKDGEIVLSYCPSLVLKAGEKYQSESQFLGCCKLSHKYIHGGEALNLEGLKNGIARPRFFNPCDGIALDRAEIKAMRKYVTEYYNVIRKEFNNILYFFFYPKKQFPETNAEIDDYLETVDRFKSLQGDTVAFNPFCKTALPTEDKPYWELCPEGSAAERIVSHTQSLGLRCGFYTGCAINGDCGNSALLPYMPKKTEWKKRDENGNIASENCLGCDEYADWWYTVQKNTIEKYSLGYWCWDPGPGNGNDCFAKNHGHIPGKGEYKGWRNSQTLLKKLKERFPTLFLQSFYGRKEYGIWGFRYFSQHEVYWEQTLLFGATLHNDFNDYRINAHGTRLQNLWSMNYRFLPAHIGHGLVTRMGERYYDQTLERAIELSGWKFSLLSAIACAGSITHCNLPDKLENVPEMEAFYKKWIKWARENYALYDYLTPISDSVANGVVDGYARINGGRGQIFLFNSSPLAVKKKLPLDESIGFSSDEPFYLRILYCENDFIECDVTDYRDRYRTGDELEIILPPYGAVILQTERERGKTSVSEIPYNEHKLDEFYLPDGESFDIAAHSAFDEVTLSSRFAVDEGLMEILNTVSVPNKDFICDNIEKWTAQGLPFNFLSSMPDRLIAYIPFAGAVMPRDVSMSLNGTDVPVRSFDLRGTPIFHYAFIENYVKWGEENDISLKIKGLSENSFLGIYVTYPDVINGLRTRAKIFDEREPVWGLHSEETLVINKVSITPSVIKDTDTEYTVTVETSVPRERIEAVYCILPTKPQMPSLNYNPQLKVWEGKFRSGERRLNIFCNPTLTAWIKGKDGGLGPKASCRVKTEYV